MVGWSVVSVEERLPGADLLSLPHYAGGILRQAGLYNVLALQHTAQLLKDVRELLLVLGMVTRPQLILLVLARDDADLGPYLRRREQRKLLQYRMRAGAAGGGAHVEFLQPVLQFAVEVT